MKHTNNSDWTFGAFGSKDDAENYIWGPLYNLGLQFELPFFDGKLWILEYENLKS